MEHPITKEDRDHLDNIKRLIDDPATSPELRSELREAFGSIANRYVLEAAIRDDPSLLDLPRSRARILPDS